MERRQFLAGMGLGGATLGIAGCGINSPINNTMDHSASLGSTAANQLHEQIQAMPFDDSHCHALSDADAQTTPQRFLARMSLAAFPAMWGGYFPMEVFKQWWDGDALTRAKLDKAHNIQATLDEITGHFRESIFVKYMVKEMAHYLDCAPRLETVIEARNAQGKDYWRYVRGLLTDVKAANLMIDTGYSEGMGQAELDRFDQEIAPAQSRRILRADNVFYSVLNKDLSFDELEKQFVAAMTRGLDGDGNYGQSSWGMKSYLMPQIGVLKPLYDRNIARADWETFKVSMSEPFTDREERAMRGKDIQRYMHTLAMEACLERDMPMQFHAGDGEAPGVILRKQDPYNLEEMVRLDKDGFMRRPKVIPLHAGYPLVGRAAWLSHLYTNCYFDLSIMTPFVHQSLATRYQEVMEVVPLSKILFASDAYHLPELYWLSGRWGKRYLAQALADYVRGGSLDEEEALEAARMILYKNNRAVYNLPG